MQRWSFSFASHIAILINLFSYLENILKKQSIPSTSITNKKYLSSIRRYKGNTFTVYNATCYVCQDSKLSSVLQNSLFSGFECPSFHFIKQYFELLVFTTRISIYSILYKTKKQKKYVFPPNLYAVSKTSTLVNVSIDLISSNKTIITIFKKL